MKKPLKNKERLKLLRYLNKHIDTANVDGCRVEVSYDINEWILKSYASSNSFKVLIEIHFNADGSYSHAIDRLTFATSWHPIWITDNDHKAELDTILSRAVSDTKKTKSLPKKQTDKHTRRTGAECNVEGDIK